jgi:hypothetical protein
MCKRMLAQLSEFAPDFFHPIHSALVLGSFFGSGRFALPPIQAVEEMDAIHFLAQGNNSRFLFGIGIHRRCPRRSLSSRTLRRKFYVSGFESSGLNQFRVCSCLLGVIGANMRCKLLVALQLEVAHHFVERFTGRWTRGVEPPGTFRATKTPKPLLFNPYQLPVHGFQCRAAPQRCLNTCPSTRLPPRTSSFPGGVLPDRGRKPSSGLAWRKMHKGTGGVYMLQF